jgi:glutathione S-transferase
MLKVWGRTNSINVQKVMWTVAELGLPHERIEAGGRFGVVGEDWFKNMNPNSRVPVIDDDGFILWESHAIVRYLAARHSPGKLYPTGLKERALAEKWMDWVQAQVGGPIFAVFFPLIRQQPAQRNQEQIRQGFEACVPLYAMLDQALAGQDWLVGGRMTIAELGVGPFAHRWLALPIQRPSMPNLEGWYKRLMERPAYRQHVALPLS